MRAAARIRLLGPVPGHETSPERLAIATGEGEPQPMLVHPVPWSVTGDPDLLAREKLEAAAAADLLHPNIQPSFGIEEVDGAPVHLLAWVEGEPLSSVIEASGRLPPDIAARVVTDACEAVQFAHDEGVGGLPQVHGDIGTQSLLVSASGVTLVAGFGRAAHPRPPRERLHLLSPEQVQGGPGAVVPQTDVYLLGLVLYTSLAGEPPFAGEKDPEEAVATRSPPPLASQGIPEKLAAVAERALAKKASDRFGSPGELARAIAEAVGELAPPSAVSTYLDIYFPPDEGVRAERRRVVDAAHEAARRAEPPGGEVSPEARPAAAPRPAAQAQPGERPPTESADELIVGVPTPVPQVIDLVTTRDILGEPTPPPDVVTTGDIVPEPRRIPTLPLWPAPVATAPLPASAATPPIPAPAVAPPPDLVTTRDIVGEVSAPSIFPRPELGPAPRRGPPVWLVGALIGVGGLSIGLAISLGGGGERGRVPSTAPPPAASLATPAAAPTPTETAVATPGPGAAREKIAAPPAVPPAPKKPAPPARTASAAPSIDVTSTPPGDVYVDGKKVGRAPLVLAVARGRHKVRLVERGKGIDLSQTVEVSGPRTPVRFVPGKGRVTITAPEGALIYIDGRKVGTSQVIDLEVYEGSHQLKVTLGAAEHLAPFQLGPDETWRYEVSRSQ